MDHVIQGKKTNIARPPYNAEENENVSSTPCLLYSFDFLTISHSPPKYNLTRLLRKSNHKSVLYALQKSVPRRLISVK